MRSLKGASSEEMLAEIGRKGRTGVLVETDLEPIISCFNTGQPVRASFAISADATMPNDAAVVALAKSLHPVIDNLQFEDASFSYADDRYAPSELTQQIVNELDRRGLMAVLFELEGVESDKPELFSISYGPSIPKAGRSIVMLHICQAIGMKFESLKAGAGYIYVLLNSSMPGLCKIGKTTREPEERAAELSRSTGVATRFMVAYYVQVPDISVAERRVHEALSYARESKDREFFRVESKVAIDVIRSLNE